MEDNDVVLSQDTVSRYHCRIVQEGNSYVLVDLGSTNGTFVNRVRVKEAFLKPGCTILLESMWRDDRDPAIARSYADAYDELVSAGYRVVEVPMERECRKLVPDPRRGLAAYLGGEYEPGVATALQRLVRPGALCADVRQCGDVIIGLNPAADDIETIVRLEQLLERVVRVLELPARYCVLSDIVKQHRARSHARASQRVFSSKLCGQHTFAGAVQVDEFVEPAAQPHEVGRAQAAEEHRELLAYAEVLARRRHLPQPFRI